MSIKYTLALNIECVNAYEADDTGEFYGAVQYRIDGQGDWIFLLVLLTMILGW